MFNRKHVTIFRKCNPPFLEVAINHCGFSGFNNTNLKCFLRIIADAKYRLIDRERRNFFVSGICQDNRALAVVCLRSLRAYFVTGEVQPGVIYEVCNYLILFYPSFCLFAGFSLDAAAAELFNGNPQSQSVPFHTDY